MARSLKAEGYNCAQSVLIPFCDIIGLDRDTAARLSSGLGSGMGATRELCGVANAMAIAQGMLQSPDPMAKGVSAKAAGELARQFSSRNQGRLRCADLKGKEGIRPCNDLVEDGVEILYNYFESLK